MIARAISQVLRFGRHVCSSSQTEADSWTGSLLDALFSCLDYRYATESWLALNLNYLHCAASYRYFHLRTFEQIGSLAARKHCVEWIMYTGSSNSHIRPRICRRSLRELDDDGPPFQWDPERRALLEAELDAAFFHLYGVSREDADYILDTFPIVRRKDEERYGEYRTKRLILEIYDAMQHAIDTGVPYQTILDPPPGQGPPPSRPFRDRRMTDVPAVESRATDSSTRKTIRWFARWGVP